SLQDALPILAQVDAETGKPLVDIIVDAAGQKGTGRWTVKSACDLGIPVTGIGEAVFARALSSDGPARQAAQGKLASGELAAPVDPAQRADFIEDVRRALSASTMVAYAQRFDQILVGSAEYGGDVDPRDLGRIWRGGCIIRARFLNRIVDAYEADPQLPSLLLDEYFLEQMSGLVDSWRCVVGTATAQGHPVPVFASSL